MIGMISAKRQFLAFLAAVVMLFSFTVATQAATVQIIPFYPYDLVDSGKHCDWDARGSIYQDIVIAGASVWNAYKPGVFRPDSIFVIQDVLIEDINRPGNDTAGETLLGKAKIEYNKAYLSSSSYSAAQRKKTVMHELGHALGLHENNGGLSTNVMRQGQLSNITLSADDKASYDAAYARY
jgi:hypothetical protein